MMVLFLLIPLLFRTASCERHLLQSPANRCVQVAVVTDDRGPEMQWSITGAASGEVYSVGLQSYNNSATYLDLVCSLDPTEEYSLQMSNPVDLDGWGGGFLIVLDEIRGRSCVSAKLLHLPL
ncbi:hypothetical protein CYMTET_28045 [Cymbomonas tetramitiformis]|uniref:Uncharacterized protein n=1 Tax=Cymbomonas tetramitiformis TaxID=36881 RepID=A0AAE0KWJ5_9CHLO|nr:hypothetical protein CYMTET_28045 [Cymbomonas tetramitiformis]